MCSHQLSFTSKGRGSSARRMAPTISSLYCAPRRGLPVTAQTSRMMKAQCELRSKQAWRRSDEAR